MSSTVTARSIRIRRCRGALLLALAIGLTGIGPLAITRAAGLDEQQPIKVAAVSGTVHVSMRGEARSVAIGDTIEPPASIDTGPDGSIELREGGTLIAIAANSGIRIPVPSEPRERLDRVIQAKGNAFYSVAKRVISHLRVETPYLVAVVKGTQFSVSALSDHTTIALFEGQLEVDAPDHSDSVELNAGQIAIRTGPGRIRVLRMNTGQTLRAAIGAGGVTIPASGVAASAGTPQVGGSSATVAGGSLSSASLSTGGSVLPDGSLTGTGPLGTSATASGASTSLAPSTSIAATSGLGTSVNVGTGGAGLSTNVGVGESLGAGSGVSASAGLGASTGVSTTGVSASAALGTNVGVASNTVGVGLGTDVNASLGTTATTGSTGLSVGAGTSTSVTTGAGAATAGVSAGASLSAGTSTGVSVGVDTSVSVGSTTVGVGTSVSTGSLLGSHPGSTSSTGTSGAVGSLLNGLTSKLKHP